MKGMPVSADVRKSLHGLALLVGVLAATGCGAAGIGPAAVLRSASQNRRAAEAEISALLGAVKVPPGAVRLNSAPIAFLGAAPETEGSPDFITLTGWWTVDASYATAVAWVRGHPPGALSIDGGGSSGGPGIPANTSFRFGAPDTDAYTGATLLIELADMDGRTGIRVDAQGIWLPAKSPLEVVTKGTPVTLVVLNDTGGSTARTAPSRLLDPADGDTVIADLNALRPSDGGARGCALDLGYRVLIAVPAHGVDEVFNDDAACNLVLVTRGGRSLPTLTGSPALENEIEHLVGPRPTP